MPEDNLGSWSLPCFVRHGVFLFLFTIVDSKVAGLQISRNFLFSSPILCQSTGITDMSKTHPAAVWVFRISSLIHLSSPLMRFGSKFIGLSILCNFSYVTVHWYYCHCKHLCPGSWGPVDPGSNVSFCQTWSPKETSLTGIRLQEHSFFHSTTPTAHVEIATLPSVAIAILSLRHWILWGNRNELPHQSNLPFADIGRWVSCSSLEKWLKSQMLTEMYR